jgi:hypothetical protein
VFEEAMGWEMEDDGRRGSFEVWRLVLEGVLIEYLSLIFEEFVQRSFAFDKRGVRQLTFHSLLSI